LAYSRRNPAFGMECIRFESTGDGLAFSKASARLLCNVYRLRALLRVPAKAPDFLGKY
jgi:hypothetical protein